jgi:hypothetical protein
MFIHQQLFEPWDPWNDAFTDACIDAFFASFDDDDCYDFTLTYIGS